MFRAVLTAVLLLSAAPFPGAGAWAEESAQPPAEIRIGNTAPYSGPASALGSIVRTAAAYFTKLNEEGGINGRRINFISYDDGYSPNRTFEMTRRLVEQERVLLDFGTLGTPTSTAVWKYLNERRVPQLFVLSGASRWGDPHGHPWTMGWVPTYTSEGTLYADYVLKRLPRAKIGLLYQNDDYGKDYVRGFKRGLGAEGRRRIVVEQTYEVTDPTVDSQIVNLQNRGVEVLLDAATPKFASQAIKKAYELGWRPVHLLSQPAASLSAVLIPAGLEACRGLISALYLKDASDPRWKDDPGVREFIAFMRRYFPGGDPADLLNVQGYTVAQTLVWVLRHAGDDLSRENLMKVASHIPPLPLPLLLPGIAVHTTPADFYPIEQLELARFDGAHWVLFGQVRDLSSANRR